MVLPPIGLEIKTTGRRGCICVVMIVGEGAVYTVYTDGVDTTGTDIHSLYINEELGAIGP